MSPFISSRFSFVFKKSLTDMESVKSVTVNVISCLPVLSSFTSTPLILPLIAPSPISCVIVASSMASSSKSLPYMTSGLPDILTVRKLFSSFLAAFLSSTFASVLNLPATVFSVCAISVSFEFFFSDLFSLPATAFSLSSPSAVCSSCI